MESLIENFRLRLSQVTYPHRRYLYEEIDWNYPLVSITGSRGVGKTTLLLQYIKDHHAHQLDKVLYVSLDLPYFYDRSLFSLADEFQKKGGIWLFLDEVHKYPNWAGEIKNIFDTYKQMKVIFTGSSILDVQKGKADLSRRLINYKLPGLSFREYLKFKDIASINPLQIEDIMNFELSSYKEIFNDLKPLQYFDDYLKTGYYPFSFEYEKHFKSLLIGTINQIFENDLISVYNIQYASSLKIKKLLKIISESVPFTPNISKLAEKLDLRKNRVDVYKYLDWLVKAELILALQSSTKGIQKLSKPEKIYLNNSNLMYALAEEKPNSGNLRETFFFNQVSNAGYHVVSSKESDFLVDHKYTYEIGGKNKSRNQIKNLKNAWLVLDNLEFNIPGKIPLWVFGFLY